MNELLLIFAVSSLFIFLQFVFVHLSRSANTFIQLTIAVLLLIVIGISPEKEGFLIKSLITLIVLVNLVKLFKEPRFRKLSK